MIEVNDKSVRLEGSIKNLLNDWMNATRVLYGISAKEAGLKNASNTFATALQIATIDAAAELMKKGELPDE